VLNSLLAIMDLHIYSFELLLSSSDLHLSSTSSTGLHLSFFDL